MKPLTTINREGINKAQRIIAWLMIGITFAFVSWSAVLAR